MIVGTALPTVIEGTTVPTKVSIPVVSTNFVGTTVIILFCVKTCW